MVAGIDDGLLADVQISEFVVVEVAEAASEVAVGLEAGVVPRRPGVGT